MKRVINKRVYNTETSKCLEVFSEQHNCQIIYVYLYQKRNGEYFLKVRGNKGTLYFNTDFMQFEDEMDGYYYEGRDTFEGEGIVPLRPEDADYYLRKMESIDHTAYYNVHDWLASKKN